MSIDRIGLTPGYFAPIEPPKPSGGTGQTKGSGAAGGASFSEVFDSAIREVDQLQKTADQQIEGLTLNKEGVTTHGAMLALEQADVAFQLMNNIRAKIIRAYEDIMRTQV